MDEIVRFAPDVERAASADSLRVALFSWARAREIDADFVLCGANDSRREDLEWLNLDWDDEEKRGKTTLSLPPIMDANGQPLPERGYRLTDFQQEGYLPLALFSYLLSLGWQTPQPLLDKWIVRTRFKLAEVSAESPTFDWQKLKSINRLAIQKLSNEQLTEQLRPFILDAYGDVIAPNEKWLLRLTPIVRDELTLLEDVIDSAEFAFDMPEMSASAGQLVSQSASRAVLAQFIAEVAAVVLLDEETGERIVAGIGRRTGEDVTKIILAALTGQTSVRPLPQILAILGKQRSMERAADAVSSKQ